MHEPRITERRSPSSWAALARVAFALVLILGPSLRAEARPQSKTFEQWRATVERAERSGEQWTVLVKDLTTGATVFSHKPSQRLIPASNRKIMVFALGMSTLGPDFKFRTELGLTESFQAGNGGTVRSAILRSDGDPTMSGRYLSGRNPATMLRGWIARLKLIGIRRIEGDFIIDASAFGDGPDAFPAAWEGRYEGESYAPAPSALTLNRNLLQVRVRPAGAVGRPGAITIYPSIEGIGLINQTRVVSGRAQGLEARFDESGRNLIVKGRVGKAMSQHVVNVPLERPANLIRSIVRDSLRAEGIQVGGQVRVSLAPLDAGEGIRDVVAEHESIPLAELMRIMMRDSDNFLAEQIWRASAAHAYGVGDTATARRLERAWYAERAMTGIEPGHDGSGLSRLNRVSASETVRVLESLFATPFRPFLTGAMPSSGRSGTLSRRSFGAAGGRVVAKTGTLNGASALSGFIRDRKGAERWVFSMIGNRAKTSRGLLSSRQNDLMEILIKALDSGRYGSAAPPAPPSRPAASPPAAPGRIPLKRYKPGTKVRVRGDGR